jgi:hypothetical protein
MASCSLVGTCTVKPLSLNATTPTNTLDGWRSTKSRAASLAASIRDGFRSSAAMLPDTSNARMTTPSIRGRLTTVCGRASETIRIVSDNRKSAGGMCRRTPGLRPAVACISPKLP